MRITALSSGTHDPFSLIQDVRIGGGVATIPQYLQVGLIDELHLAVSPVFLGQGENLFAGLDLPKLGYQRTEHVPSAGATHVVITKRVA